MATNAALAQRAVAAAGRAADDTKRTVDFNDIQRMLINGGYHRARLSSVLSEYDIVAGGLSWCILNSRYTIDVAFVENAAIRDKIKAGENICKALQHEMQCPHPLAPHQIQGLDYPSIAITLHWLLKRVALVREENAYSVAQFTHFDFQRRFGITLQPTGLAPKQEFVFGSPTTTTVPGNADAHLIPSGGPLDGMTHYRQHSRYWRNARRVGGNGGISALAPKRVARAHTSSKATTVEERKALFHDAFEHVTSALLEYGDQYVVAEGRKLIDPTATGDANNSNDKSKLIADDDMDAAEKRERAQQLEEQESERKMLDGLLQNMATANDKAKISSAGLGSAMANADFAKMAKLRAHYDERKEALRQQLEAEEAERNKIERRRERLVERQQELDGLQSKLQRNETQMEKAKVVAQENVDALKAEEDAANAKRIEVETEEARLRDEDPDFAARLDKLENVFSAIQEANRAHDEELETGREQLASVRNEVQEMQDRLERHTNAEDDPELNAEIERLEVMRSEMNKEVHRLDLELIGVQRSIDSHPTRQELIIYDTRLAELAEEVGWKSEETQLAFQKNNTLAEVAKVYQNQKDVFTRVKEGFEECTDSSTKQKQRETLQKEFLEEAETILTSLIESSEQQLGRMMAARSTLREETERYSQTTAMQREYQQVLDKVNQALEQRSVLKKQIRGAEIAQAAEEEAL